MSIPVSQLKVGDSYVSKSGKGGVRTITFLGEIRGGDGKGNKANLPSGIAYIERRPKQVDHKVLVTLDTPYIAREDSITKVVIDQTAREATTLHISTRQSFAKWASYKVLISFSE